MIKHREYRGETGRKCIRCGTLMSNKYWIGAHITATQYGNAILPDQKPVKSLICPKCGEVSLYVDEPEDVAE